MLYDPDEYEAVVEYKPCGTCGGDLSKCRGTGCNGSGSLTHRQRSPEEVARIKAERARAEEDRILTEAERIRARRALTP